MSLNDPLANVLSSINNYELRGKSLLIIKNNSKLIRNVLKILKENSYIGDFEELEGGRGLKISLLGSVNKVGVIKPRFQIKKTEFGKFEKRYLPARDFGLIIVSTNKGLMTNKEAKDASLGGTLIAYCY